MFLSFYFIGDFDFIKYIYLICLLYLLIDFIIFLTIIIRMTKTISVF